MRERREEERRMHPVSHIFLNPGARERERERSVMTGWREQSGEGCVKRVSRAFNEHFVLSVCLSLFFFIFISSCFSVFLLFGNALETANRNPRASMAVALEITTRPVKLIVIS